MDFTETVNENPLSPANLMTTMVAVLPNLDQVATSSGTVAVDLMSPRDAAALFAHASFVNLGFQLRTIRQHNKDGAVTVELGRDTKDGQQLDQHTQRSRSTTPTRSNSLPLGWNTSSDDTATTFLYGHEQILGRKFSVNVSVRDSTVIIEAKTWAESPSGSHPPVANDADKSATLSVAVAKVICTGLLPWRKQTQIVWPNAAGQPAVDLATPGLHHHLLGRSMELPGPDTIESLRGVFFETQIIYCLSVLFQYDIVQVLLPTLQRPGYHAIMERPTSLIGGGTSAPMSRSNSNRSYKSTPMSRNNSKNGSSGSNGLHQGGRRGGSGGNWRDGPKAAESSGQPLHNRRSSDALAEPWRQPRGPPDAASPPHSPRGSHKRISREFLNEPWRKPSASLGAPRAPDSEATAASVPGPAPAPAPAPAPEAHFPRPTVDFPPPDFEDEHQILRAHGPRQGSRLDGGGNGRGIGFDDLNPPHLGPNDPLRPSLAGGNTRLGPGGFVGGGQHGGPGGFSGMHPTFDDPLFTGIRGQGGDNGLDPQNPPGARWDDPGPVGGDPSGIFGEPGGNGLPHNMRRGGRGGGFGRGGFGGGGFGSGFGGPFGGGGGGGGFGGGDFI